MSGAGDDDDVYYFVARCFDGEEQGPSGGGWVRLLAGLCGRLKFGAQVEGRPVPVGATEGAKPDAFTDAASQSPVAVEDDAMNITKEAKTKNRPKRIGKYCTFFLTRPTGDSSGARSRFTPKTSTLCEARGKLRPRCALPHVHDYLGVKTETVRSPRFWSVRRTTIVDVPFAIVTSTRCEMRKKPSVLQQNQESSTPAAAPKAPSWAGQPRARPPKMGPPARPIRLEQLRKHPGTPHRRPGGARSPPATQRLVGRPASTC